MAGEESGELHLHTPGIGQQLARWTPLASVRLARRGSCAAAKFGEARRRLQGAGSLPRERRDAMRQAACGQRGGRSVPVRLATGPRSSCSFQQQIRGEQRGGDRHLRRHLRAASFGCPGRSSRAHRWAHYDQLRRVHSRRPGPVPRGVAGGCFCVGQHPPQVSQCALDAQTLHRSLSLSRTALVLTACLCHAHARVRCRARRRGRHRC